MGTVSSFEFVQLNGEPFQANGHALVLVHFQCFVEPFAELSVVGPIVFVFVFVFVFGFWFGFGFWFWFGLRCVGSTIRVRRVVLVDWLVVRVCAITGVHRDFFNAHDS